MNSSQQNAIAVAIDLRQYVFWLQQHMVDRAIAQTDCNSAQASAQQVEATVNCERWMSRRQF